MTRIPAALAAILAVSTASGCAGPLPDACPAIGWFHTLSVELTGDVGAVAVVRLCVEDACAPGPEADGFPGAVQRAVSPDDDTWTFQVSELPAEFSVRVLGEDGDVLADVPAAPDWVRVGGTERCGGPHEATMIVEV